MATLTNEQIMELQSLDSQTDEVFVINKNSKVEYKLIESHKHGMKGLIWKVKDNIGNTLALKLIPTDDYEGRSLIDEMTFAQRLKKDFFAEIIFFGELFIEGIVLSNKYYAVVIEWVEGKDIKDFSSDSITSVSIFISILRQLFTAIASLRNNNLCHDDFHPGNIMVQIVKEDLYKDEIYKIKIIDTGTLKRIETRQKLLSELRSDISKSKAQSFDTKLLEERLNWKTPDDHIRLMESVILLTNSLISNYHKLDLWERKFVDSLDNIYKLMIDDNLERRLDDPATIMSMIENLEKRCIIEERDERYKLLSPFDYISAEMIRNDREFAELFSKECPWLNDCKIIEPLYIYGPRGCGKSSVLRWLSFKVYNSDPTRRDFDTLESVGIYISCSVELRSRFWLFSEDTIKKLLTPTIRFFNLLLLEELFDTLSLMVKIQNEGQYNFGITDSEQYTFTNWFINRLSPSREKNFRLQGQSHFEYLKSFVRRYRWETWARIKVSAYETENPDPALVNDVCRELSNCFSYLKSRHIIFLIDDYSNQRIPSYLQRYLNQTISFAKQGTPLFKVTSEYEGVDLEGIQEGREVFEINIGEKYLTLQERSGANFLTDIINIRLSKTEPPYKARIQDLLGQTSYEAGRMADAILSAKIEGTKFYYHGIECIHWLCSGDVALALNLIKKIFEHAKVKITTDFLIEASKQDYVIQQFSHDEIHRIKYLVPWGENMHDIVCYLGSLSRAVVLNKKHKKKDRKEGAMCMTHIDIRLPVIQELNAHETTLNRIYKDLIARSVLITLNTSRSRISHGTERLQLRKIYLPSFQAPLQRDVPIKIDDIEELKSLLSNPRTFVERKLRASDIDLEQLQIILDETKIKPKD